MKQKSKKSQLLTRAPLAGIRVLDLTRILSGPFCTMKLGDMGAEVIKIEQPETGDETRRWGPPFVRGESAYFLAVNRNKMSMTLDLKSTEGKQILTRLIRESDVLVENFRAGVMDKHGFSYRLAKQLNPGLVYCSISGYGQTSSRSHQPSYDLIVQGESGLMDVTGFAGGPPTKAGISLADVNAGNIAFEGILLALFQRERTDIGQHVDISLLDALVSLFAYQSQIALSSRSAVSRKGNRHPTITPYETYATNDGYINVAVASEPAWKNLCRAIGRDGLAGDDRFASNALRVQNRSALEKILVPVMKKKSSTSWLRILSRADIPVGRINSVAEALRMPVMNEREMLAKVTHSRAGALTLVGNPIKLVRRARTVMQPPPLLGEHTNKILGELGYSRKQIARLRAQRII